MALAISILLVGTGAVLVWGVNAAVGGLDLNIVGWIAIAVGLVGAVLSMLTYGRARTHEHPRRGYGVRP